MSDLFKTGDRVFVCSMDGVDENLNIKLGHVAKVIKIFPMGVIAAYNPKWTRSDGTPWHFLGFLPSQLQSI